MVEAFSISSSSAIERRSLGLLTFKSDRFKRVEDISVPANKKELLKSNTEQRCEISVHCVPN